MTTSLSATSPQFLDTSRDGDSTTSLGSTPQSITTLSDEKLSLISDLNLPWHNLMPEKCFFHVSYSLPWGDDIYYCNLSILIRNISISHSFNWKKKGDEDSSQFWLWRNFRLRKLLHDYVCLILSLTCCSRLDRSKSLNKLSHYNHKLNYNS